MVRRIARIAVALCILGMTAWLSEIKMDFLSGVAVGIFLLLLVWFCWE